MYRQFSQALIDAGAAVVAGCHAHCVQGGEQYKDGYIVYGLGNFFLPNHVFANGKLFYPPFSSTQLVLEYDPATTKAYCHWFRYEKQAEDHLLEHTESSTFESSMLLKRYSPYQCMDPKGYTSFFKKNRRKKLLIPVFKNYQNESWLTVLTMLLKTRATLARVMARLHLIKWGS
jgi:poly-gamma-glutamate synthesis protein (capsule biosynthesis protein)